MKENPPQTANLTHKAPYNPLWFYLVPVVNSPHYVADFHRNSHVVNKFIFWIWAQTKKLKFPVGGKIQNTYLI